MADDLDGMALSLEQVALLELLSKLQDLEAALAAERLARVRLEARVSALEAHRAGVRSVRLRGGGKRANASGY